MIVFCSTVFWIGLFSLFLGGFQFISLYVDLVNTIVEYLFSMFFLSLLVMLFFSSGIIVYTALFHSREARLPADDAGPDRSDLRLQVCRSHGLFELGLLPAGQPVDGGLWLDRAGPRQPFTGCSWSICSRSS